jgi:hypothetical protein
MRVPKEKTEKMDVTEISYIHLFKKWRKTYMMWKKILPILFLLVVMCGCEGNKDKVPTFVETPTTVTEMQAENNTSDNTIEVSEPDAVTNPTEVSGSDTITNPTEASDVQDDPVEDVVSPTHSVEADVPTTGAVTQPTETAPIQPENSDIAPRNENETEIDRP